MESIMSHRASTLSFTLTTTSLPSKMSVLQQPTTRTPFLNFCPNLQNQTRALTTKDLPSLLFHHNHHHYPSNSSSFKVYSSLNLFSSDQSNIILQDVGATGLVMAGAYSLVLVFDNLTKNQVIQQNHIGASLTIKDLPLLLFHHNHRHYPSNSSSFKVYSSLNLFNSDQSNIVLQDVGATGLVMVGAYSLVLVFDNLTKNQVIQQERRLSHCSISKMFIQNTLPFKLNVH
ncbi:hypothetical protein C5167_001402 [Papaver somniferum]|uniref:Uncharacterized protein n=1 Tax=Papaver somniferum TaxID=3469 RepID=A0A4Y7KYJ7_PAPSO|nr:hypothetical protein C5167_001402 [Papaver somniferum]